MFAPYATAVVLTTDFSSLVEEVSPSIVRVNVTKKVSAEELAQIQTAQVLRQYLGADIPEMSPIKHSHGTGFFVSADGYLLTNHHVVVGADTITITLPDRTELDAQLIGSDESSDVAVLKVNGNFRPLPIAPSDNVKVGEAVLAIGSPYGFDYSASAGIVSAKSRNLGQESSVPFIQSDVALNPGNSGGPLFNGKGEVIGINSRIFSQTGSYAGLSFSIPINAAMAIYDEIVRTGKVVRVYLGVTVQDMDRNLAQAYGLERPQGAILTRITDRSPAQKAGLKSGDVILMFNGQTINEAADLLTLINRSRPNTAFDIVLLRNGQQYRSTGVFELLREEETTSNGIKLGLNLRTLPSAEALSYGVSGGVVITGVEPFGIASKAGLATGDVIVGLNGHAVLSVKDFADAVKTLPNQGVVTVQLFRQGVPAIIGMRIE